MMKYGHFDDDNKEYVIQRPDTPYPWINYLGNEEFFSIISNTAGGYCFYKDARLRRITRYRYNNIPIDSSGKYFYINDNGQVWNPGWQPTRTALDEYQCRHGMGYTIIKGQKNDLCAEVLSFVPLGFNGEVQKLTLKNKSKAKKSFTVYSFVEWCFWNAMDDMTNFQRNLSLGEVEIEGSALYHKTEYKERRNHYAFYSVNSKINGYDTDREAFLGMYNGADRPDAVFKNKSSNSIAHGWSPMASHSIKISLEPGEEKELVFVLGYVENAEEEKWQEPGIINKTKAKEMAARFNKPAKADAALEQLKSHWKELFSSYQVKTHDPKLDRMINVWNQYQCMVTFNMSRSASYFESGIGRGMGFRDSNQDMIGSVHQAPDRARARILDAAATQFEDGGAYHQYQPLTKNGNHEIGSNFNDDPLWLILSITEYIKETGDYGILDEMVPFDNDQSKAASLFEHLKRSFYYTVNHLGPHKLPLIGQADWNDCLNLNCFSDNPDESFQTTSNKTDGTAESIFIAAMFVLYGSEFARLCQKTVHAREMIKIQKHIAEMREAINLYGWDGDWFLRAYDYFGEKVGSNTCQEGKIFIEPQGFCVMAGIGLGDGKAQKALDSVKKYLDCDYGIVLNNPPFTKYHKNLGEISTYPQGYKENASVFCHNNPWVMIAEAMIGRGERAFEYYRKISPGYLEEIAELHRTEPYVYAQMISGKDAYKPGEAKNSWLTGTAAWNFYAMSQYILGVKPDYDGLLIEPCIPAEWDGFTVIRKFRGAKYHIEVVNPEHISKGVQQLIVDGEEIKGNLIPVYEPGSVHKVEVTMGSHRPARKGHAKIKIKDVKPKIKSVSKQGEISEDEVLRRD